jgi:RimJ/RimL family protein N-acetyltransferase
MVDWAAEHLFTTTSKHRLGGETRVDNIAMRRVFERCGWKQEAHYRQSWPTADGGWLDSIGYAILRDDWHAGRPRPN